MVLGIFELLKIFKLLFEILFLFILFYLRGKNHFSKIRFDSFLIILFVGWWWWWGADLEKKIFFVVSFLKSDYNQFYIKKIRFIFRFCYKRICFQETLLRQ